jgi:hypothetical protein
VAETQRQEDRLSEKYVVYSDENYHTSWIYPDASREIVAFLTSPRRGERQFVAVNADNLKRWIETRLRNDDAYGTVIVFSQDMIPDTVAPDFSPSIILRTYLDNGGRIIWMGDHPFWRQGKHRQDGHGWTEWQFYGMFAILGLNAEFNYSPIAKVSISDQGKDWGLSVNNLWYGTRPVQEKSDQITILAESSGRRIKFPQLLKSEGEGKEKDERTISSLKEFLNVSSLYVGLLAAILAVFSSLLIQNVVYALVPITLFLIAAFLIIPKIWKRLKPTTYANAWIKTFNSTHPDSGFVRIWDCQLYDVSESMLEDLLNVALHNFKVNKT